MPRLAHQNPKYRKHRASGQAVVTIAGDDVYLGPYGTAASKREYDRVIGEWLAAGRQRPADRAADLSIVELVAAYWRHSQQYHKPQEAGGSAGELRGIKLALSYVKRLYADAPVSTFGPLALKTVREAMVSAGWSRTYTNAQVNRVRRMFKWAVGNELAPASVLHGLQALDGLRFGKTEARETDPVQPVPEDVVLATLPHLSRHVRAMVELQLLTGMRPGELCALRTADVDRTVQPWVYRPTKHKTRHRGHERAIYLGPKAQAVVTPFLKLDAEVFCFSPADAEAQRREEAHASRSTPMSCGNTPGSHRRRRPGRKPGTRYAVDAYRRAIARACEDAFGMPDAMREPRTTKQKAQRAGEDAKARRAARMAWHRQHVWHPHQLRHSAATRLRKEYGLEAAQVVLGHKTLAVTEIYAEKNVAAAKRVMAEAG